MSDGGENTATGRSRTWQIAMALIPYAALILLFAAMGIRDLVLVQSGERAAFFTASTFQLLMKECAPVVVAATGMTLVIIAGGIDLSAGSIMALAGAAAGYVTNATGSALQGMLAGCLLGGVCGGLNGSLVVALRVQPFIATLGTMMALRGLCELLTKGSIAIGDGWEAAKSYALLRDFQFISRKEIPGVGISYVVLVAAGVVGLFWWVLNQTRLGRRIYAVGSNESAARLSGVRVPVTKLAVYTLAGLLAGLAGVLSAARVGGPSSNANVGDELRVIAAVVIGGASLAGGQGKISGCIVGALLMSSLATACTLLQVQDAWQKVIVGGFLVAAVAVDEWRRRR